MLLQFCLASHECIDYCYCRHHHHHWIILSSLYASDVRTLEAPYEVSETDTSAQMVTVRLKRQDHHIHRSSINIKHYLSSPHRHLWPCCPIGERSANRQCILMSRRLVTYCRCSALYKCPYLLTYLLVDLALGRLLTREWRHPPGQPRCR